MLQPTKDTGCKHAMLQNKYNHFLFLQTDMSCCNPQRMQVAIKHKPCCKQIQPFCFFANWQMQFGILYFFSRCYHTMVQSNITSCCKQTHVYSLVAIRHAMFLFFSHASTHMPCCKPRRNHVEISHMPCCKQNTNHFLQTDTPCCKLQRNQVAITRLFMLQTHSIPAVVAT
jgi:hypothetical protein